MMPGTALSERDRQIIVGTGMAIVALFCIGVQPWNQPGSDLFVYPPHARLLMLPFGAMPVGAAVAIWIVLNLFCMFRAGESLSPRLDLALLACVSPAVLLLIASGYPGGFLALMATVVLTQGRRRPGVAGLCLALMSVHPQLALLFALLLLPLGYWRAVVTAAVWTLALVAASVITCGLQPWTDFLDAAVVQPAAAISLRAGVRMMGLPDWAAQAAQWTFGFAVLAGAAQVFLRRGPEPRGVALLLLAVVLALPDSGGEGLALAMPALTLALFAASEANDRPLLPFVPALLLWTLPVLAVLFGAASLPVVPVALAAIVLHAQAREIAWKPGGAGQAVRPL